MAMMLFNHNLIVDTTTSNGVATELFSIVQAPISIDVDENSIKESSCEPDPACCF